MHIFNRKPKHAKVALLIDWKNGGQTWTEGVCYKCKQYVRRFDKNSEWRLASDFNHVP